MEEQKEGKETCRAGIKGGGGHNLTTNLRYQ